jgi:hypothetical protein
MPKVAWCNVGNWISVELNSFSRTNQVGEQHSGIRYHTVEETS